MKIFLSGFINKVAGQILNRLAIDYDTPLPLENSGVTHFFTNKNPDIIVKETDIAEIQKIVNYKFDTRKYLLNKFNFTLENYSLDDKYDLYQVLTALNMPTIPTIYPTTAKEVEDFFTEHTNVFIKSRLYYASSEPNVYNIFASGNRNMKNIMTEGVTYIKDNIQFPSSYNHYYKKYNSISDFNSDIPMQEFLTVQTTNALPLQCIIQKDIDPTLSSITKHFHIMGYVNGTGDVYHESYYLIDKVFSNVDESYKKENKFWQKIVFDPNTKTQQEIETIINTTRQNYGSDEYNMVDKLKQILQYAGVKNTTFSAEGYVTPDNQVMFYDFSVGNALMFRRSYWSDEQKLQRLKFMNDDSSFDESIAVDNLHRFYFPVICSNGLNSELANLANTLNIALTAPVHTGDVIFPCVAYGTDPATVAANAKSFITACNPPT